MLHTILKIALVAYSLSPVQTTAGSTVDMTEVDSAGTESQPAEQKPVQSGEQEIDNAVQSQPLSPAAESAPVKVEPEPETQNQMPDNEPPPVKVEPEPESQNQMPDNEPESAKVEPDAANKKDLGEQATKFIEHLPQRVSFFTAGVIVGAPAIFVRHSLQYTVSNTRELIGTHKNPLLVVPAGALSVPYALSSGLIEGTVFGVTNSFKHSGDKQISKVSLGLEDK